MKLLRPLIALFFIGLSVSCSPIYGVSYDYNRDADFKHLRTHGWLPVPDKANLNSLDLERIKKAVDVELQTKGLKMATDNPDFLVAGHLVKKDKVNVTNWGYGYGHYGRYWGPGGVNVYQYEEGSLILDFVDAESKDLIWRGVAKADFDDATTPEKRDKLIKEAVQKILKNFPPPSPQ